MRLDCDRMSKVPLPSGCFVPMRHRVYCGMMCCVPTGPEGRLASLSITAASRGRSSGSGSRLWSAGVSVVRRFSMFGRSGLLSGSSHTPVAAPPQHALHLSVRIGIATGRLPYGCDLNTCPVKDRAKSELIVGSRDHPGQPAL